MQNPETHRSKKDTTSVQRSLRPKTRKDTYTKSYTCERRREGSSGITLTSISGERERVGRTPSFVEQFKKNRLSEGGSKVKHALTTNPRKNSKNKFFKILNSESSSEDKSGALFLFTFQESKTSIQRTTPGFEFSSIKILKNSKLC